MPPNTVVVSRPSKWGNPFAVGGYAGYRYGKTEQVWLIRDRCSAVRWFRVYLRETKALADIREELRGKNLACWCPLNEPCHADVLLELANT